VRRPTDPRPSRHQWRRARGTQGDRQAQRAGGSKQLALADRHADVISGLSPEGLMILVDYFVTGGLE
jgi:hypothetical protein